MCYMSRMHDACDMSRMHDACYLSRMHDACDMSRMHDECYMSRMHDACDMSRMHDACDMSRMHDACDMSRMHMSRMQDARYMSRMHDAPRQVCSAAEMAMRQLTTPRLRSASSCTVVLAGSLMRAEVPTSPRMCLVSQLSPWHQTVRHLARKAAPQRLKPEVQQAPPDGKSEIEQNPNHTTGAEQARMHFER